MTCTWLIIGRGFARLRWVAQRGHRPFARSMSNNIICPPRWGGGWLSSGVENAQPFLFCALNVGSADFSPVHFYRCHSIDRRGVVRQRVVEIGSAGNRRLGHHQGALRQQHDALGPQQKLQIINAMLECPLGWTRTFGRRLRPDNEGRFHFCLFVEIIDAKIARRPIRPGGTEPRMSFQLLPVNLRLSSFPAGTIVGDGRRGQDRCAKC